MDNCEEEEQNPDASFDLLEDTELLEILRSGRLNEEPTFSTQAVTATQVLRINTQDLVPAASTRICGRCISITCFTHLFNPLIYYFDR